MKLYVYPYCQASKSAKTIAEHLECKRLLREGSSVADSEDLFIINWGSSNCPYTRAKVLNKPEAIEKVINKKTFFEYIDIWNSLSVNDGETINIPEYTTSKLVAEAWINRHYSVCCREVLTGNRSRGLSIADTVDQLIDAKLYTKYINKSAEYRIHVVNGEVIRREKKLFPYDLEVKDRRIRDEQSGVKFIKQDLAPVPVIKQAKLAIKATNLDFGAVDIVYLDNKATVLEINTAPGVVDYDADAYANSFRDIYESISA